jgi:hypothetical protein
VPGSGRGFGGVGPPTGPSPVRVSPAMVSVTPASGETMEGRLRRTDDFLVTLTTADGTFRNFRGVGDAPRVVVTDPLAPHKALLPIYTTRTFTI